MLLLTVMVRRRQKKKKKWTRVSATSWGVGGVGGGGGGGGGVRGVGGVTTRMDFNVSRLYKNNELTSRKWSSSVSSVWARQWAEPVTVVHRNGSEWVYCNCNLRPTRSENKCWSFAKRPRSGAASVSLTEDAWRGRDPPRLFVCLFVSEARCIHTSEMSQQLNLLLQLWRVLEVDQ